MSPLAPRLTKTTTVVAACLALGATALIAPSGSSAQPTGSHADRSADSSSAVTLAPGITMRHVSMWSDYAPEQVVLLKLDLSVPGVRLDSASPSDMVGAQRRTVRAQTDNRHAIAGINADFFDLASNTASPRGALITSGRMLKSPTDDRNADVVVRRAKRGLVASVGPLGFDGQITRIRKGHTLRRTLTAVDSLVSARSGGVTLLTDEMSPSFLGRPCALATGNIKKGRWTVGSVSSESWRTPNLTPSTWGLLSCSGTGKRWIRDSLRRGDQVVVNNSIKGGMPWAAVSGGSVLIKNGRAWHDPLGEQLPYPGRNAETFVCVGRWGRKVTLGTIDGYSRRSAGVTYHELTNYMLTLPNCWSGTVLDGGGSTTMVARLPGQHEATVQNVPADDPPRPVADSLIVFGR